MLLNAYNIQYVLYSSLLPNSNPLYECTIICLLSFLWIEYLVFQFLIIMGKDAKNIVVQVFVCTYTFIYLGKIPVNRIVGNNMDDI